MSHVSASTPVTELKHSEPRVSEAPKKSAVPEVEIEQPSSADLKSEESHPGHPQAPKVEYATDEEAQALVDSGEAEIPAEAVVPAEEAMRQEATD